MFKVGKQIKFNSIIDVYEYYIKNNRKKVKNILDYFIMMIII